MAPDSTTGEFLKIGAFSTPQGVVVTIEDSHSGLSPWGVTIPWLFIQSKTASSIAKEALTMWATARPDESKGSNLSDMVTQLAPFLIQTGNSFTGFSPIPEVSPEEGILRIEKRYFMGPDGFAGFQRDHLYHMRFIQFVTGNTMILPDHAPWLKPILLPKVLFKEHFLTQEGIDSLIFELRSKVRKIPQSCYNPECTSKEKSIKSHVLQENGILDKIAEPIKDSISIIEITVTNIIERRKGKANYKFQNKPIAASNELRFFGFCDYCDNKELESLNKRNADFSTIKNQTLLVYCGLLNELYKKESNLRHYLEIEKNNRIPKTYKEKYNEIKLEQMPGLLISYGWKLRIEQYLKGINTTPPFEFVYFTLPKIKIAASCLVGLSMGFYKQFTDDELLAIQPGYQLNLIPAANEQTDTLCVLHLIPTENELLVSISYTKADPLIGHFPVSKINSMSEAERIRIISDLLIAYGETWCVAPSMYADWQASGMDTKILKEIQAHMPSHLKSSPTAFSLFGNAS